ncbi:MAG: SPOR domain-containing protein [Bacteroidales bacterium]|nr:SPOR domain-containing protein [Bacteroidales bacterium]
MNITDLIVEQLKQGNSVELAGIGTLGSELQSPRHDKARGVYYPAHRTLVFNGATSGNDSMVNLLAERECVGTEVARQMWKNYIDALSDKLKHTGSHAFGELGTLHAGNDGYRFEAAEGLVLSVGDEKPLEDVKIYAHDNEEDPFAQFDDEPVAPAPEPEPEPVPEPEPEPIPEPEPEPEPISEPKPEPVPVPEPEPEPVTAPAPEPEPVKQEASWNEDLKKLEEMPTKESPKKVKKEKKEKAEKNEKKKNKGKNRWWLLLLLLLLLLLIGGGVYYLLTHRTAKEAVPVEATPTERLTDVPVTNDLTYNYDLLEYDRRDIAYNRDLVCRYMTDYIDSYLAYRHYTGARVPMMDRVRQYAEERLGTLMADRFAIQRFIPFNDYIYNHNEPWMRQTFASRQRVTVQSELLNMNILDGILDPLVTELGIEPDAGAPRTAEQVQQVKAEERKTIERRKEAKEEPAPVRVNMEQNSKQGFDIIAGFYLDRATAARLTARLHELGSDAYIIEKNNMYYVSMGSAKDRTSAEALFKHIKSWYDGDIAIKQW